MSAIVLLWLGTVVTLLAVGYLLGVHTGKAGRGALRTALASAEYRGESNIGASNDGTEEALRALSAQLSAGLGRSSNLQESPDVKALIARIDEERSGFFEVQTKVNKLERQASERQSIVPAQQLATQLKAELVSLVEDATSARTQTNSELAFILKAELAPLIQAKQTAPASNGTSTELITNISEQIVPLAQGMQRTEKLQTDLQKQMQSLIAKDHVTTALDSLTATLAETSDLPAALTLIADAAGFGTVVLSDDVGLPIATNSGGKDADIHAGLSSLVLTFIDRVASNGLPAPLAAVLRDEANQVVIHRVFAVGRDRYVLTAVATGKLLAPEALDSTLQSLARIIDRDRW